jgi:hypothetical protein
MLNRFFATLLFALLLVSCQKEQNFAAKEESPAEESPATEEVAGSSYFLTVEATKGMDTKALALEGNTLNAKWATGEKVGVYVNGERRGQLTATVDGTDPTKATLSGTVTGISKGVTFMLLFPDREDISEGSKWDYTGQNGAAPDGDLAAKYDYATATLTVSGVNGNEVTTTGTATFQNQQSIYRMDFKVNSTLKSVKWFSVFSSQNKLVTSRSYDNGWGSTYGCVSVSLASAASSPYLSLRNENTTDDDTYTFFARDCNNKLYTGTKEIENQYLGYGKFLAPSVDLSAYSVATQASGSISNAQDIF